MSQHPDSPRSLAVAAPIHEAPSSTRVSESEASGLDVARADAPGQVPARAAFARTGRVLSVRAQTAASDLPRAQAPSGAPARATAPVGAVRYVTSLLIALPLALLTAFALSFVSLEE